MRRLTLRLAVAVTAFVIGIASATAWLVNNLSESDRVSHIDAPRDSIVNFCDLISRPEQYDGSVVRTRATITGFHMLILSDSACIEENNFVRADFTPQLRGKFTAAYSSAGESELHEGNFRAEVTLIGRFEKVASPSRYQAHKRADKQFISYSYRIDVSDISSVIPE